MAINIKNQIFTLHTKNSTYQMKVDEQNMLIHTYYGNRTDDTDCSYLIRMADRGFSGNIPGTDRERVYSLDFLPQEFPVYGDGDYRVDCLKADLGSGVQDGMFFFDSYQVREGKYNIPGLPAFFSSEKSEGETLEIVLKDAVEEVYVHLLYGVFEELDIITRAAVVENRTEGDIQISRIMSACLDLGMGKYDLIHFYGKHAGERQMERNSLPHGITELRSTRGTSSHQHNPFVILADKDTTESTGECYSASFLYSGGFHAQAEVDQFNQTRLVIGIDDYDFSWKLKKGESFSTPEVCLTYSADGFSKLSQTLHQAIVSNLIRSCWKDRVRPILVNNWEATYFDFNKDNLIAIAKEAAELNLDMLVLDDGWFGKRDDDFSGLGDWFVNEKKLCGTLSELVKEVHDMGLSFGLWFEPEMISEDSDLYREHPDWALKIPGRAMNRSRHQLNLDITRKEVREHIMNQIFKVLDACKADYVKWDMNRSVDNVFSAALPKERQGEVYHRYVLAVYEMMESLVQRYPDLLFESCSGGGGRFEAGMLYYSPQIWCSDNTDAIDRLKIQYGTSFGYPISAMGAHVSVCPNHQSGRTTPFETRGIVASAGTFGYELDLMKMSEEEKKTAREQILKYKEMEHLVQSGDYYRLVNPFENNNHVLWQFVSKDKKETVVCGVRLHSEANPYIYLFYPQGLDADLHYEDIATGKVYTGAALMKAGLPLPLTTGDYQPIRFTFKAVEK